MPNNRWRLKARVLTIEERHELAMKKLGQSIETYNFSAVVPDDALPWGDEEEMDAILADEEEPLWGNEQPIDDLDVSDEVDKVFLEEAVTAMRDTVIKVGNRIRNIVGMDKS